MHKKAILLIMYTRLLESSGAAFSASFVSTRLQESSADIFLAILQLINLVDIIFDIPKEGTK